MFDLLPHLKRILQWLTFKRVIMLGFGSIVWIISWTIFENRNQLLDITGDRVFHVQEPQPLRISNETARFIEKFTRTTENVAFTKVVSANMYRNSREVVYWTAADPVVAVEMESYLQKHGNKAPLLGETDDTNLSIIRTINGDFTCTEGTSTTITRTVPLIKEICRISVPPYYGKFSGYVTIGFLKKPTSDQMAAAKRAAVEISSVIYFENSNERGRR